MKKVSVKEHVSMCAGKYTSIFSPKMSSIPETKPLLKGGLTHLITRANVSSKKNYKI